MAVFTVDTVHNVGIDFETSGVGDRMIGEIIDTCVKVGYVLGMLLLLNKTNSMRIMNNPYVAFMLFSPFLFYGLLFEYFNNGQTPGKMLRKIKVSRLDGTSPTLGDYTVRWLFRLIDINITSGVAAVVSITASKHHQRLGDILACTTVVKVSKPITLEELTYEKTTEDYAVSYPEVLRLSQEDVDLIQKVLKNKDYSENFDMNMKLAERIAAKMKVKRREAYDAFLVTVVKDYSTLAND